MIHELRQYIPAKGKAELLSRRFRESTLDLFKELRFRVVDFWEATDGTGQIWYVVEWADTDEMKTAWDSFRAHPKWMTAKAATEADGPLVEKIQSFVLRRPPYFEP